MGGTMVTITLEAVTCCDCGVMFGIEASHRAELLQNHAWFYCPNGHRQHYTAETEADKVRRELKRVREHADWLADLERQEREARQAADRSRAALKGQVTRIKRKVAAGQCPCCRTKFADLAAHMAESHPDFADPAPRDRGE